MTDLTIKDLNLLQLSYDLGGSVGLKQGTLKLKTLFKLYNAKSLTVPPVNYPFY